MSELVGRFLSFEEQLGRGLVRFLYYVLLFLLVVTTLWEMTTSAGALGDAFWPNLWRLLATVPLTFLVKLLLLRVGAELVMAILTINDNLQGGVPEGDVMSSGLNVGGQTPPSTMRAGAINSPDAGPDAPDAEVQQGPGPETGEPGP